jgi:hypothetical protein
VILYRLTKNYEPTAEDFTSNAARGRPFPPNLHPDLHWLWDGLSAYEHADQALALAARSPRIGRYLATLNMTRSEEVRWLRTTASAGHYTIWGAPEELLKCVVSVNPILPAQPR